MMNEEFENLLVEVAEHQRNRFFGKYRGKVTDVNDPNELGYIKAIVPEVYGETLESPWAAPAVPFAGASHGLVAIPEIDDGVWFEFEAGNISRPVWTGFWWGDGELPEPGGIQTRAFITTKGHKLILDDDADEVKLLHADGAEITMTGGEISIQIGLSEGKLTGTGEISFKVGASEIKITAADISLQSGAGSIKISAAGVNINNGAINVT